MSIIQKISQIFRQMDGRAYKRTLVEYFLCYFEVINLYPKREFKYQKSEWNEQQLPHPLVHLDGQMDRQIRANLNAPGARDCFVLFQVKLHRHC